ncbi:ABC transporter ATP-binding protein [Enterocloster citroniae]|uniref:ABC transporter ATP-binding protein n=1 Tax=Enterocloster citroniae TaxID=358743 RepID=UPI0008EBFB77|nr:ABC transporter ATP-binding protein [Enterocloster citroniae]SFS05897.1 peptide/nickel transport system ATP-binding protein [Enterocloster citroniae]
MSENLIEVKKLVTQFSGKNGTVTAVDGVSFHIKKGETLGIVGESGCGKSVTSMSILRLIPPQSGKIASGEILFKGKDLTRLNQKEIRQIRGNEIAMIFQDSMTGLNPVMTIGKQLVETITAHSKMDKKQAWKRAEEMLMKVGIPSPAQRLKEYPHQLSGGMRQRVMIAMALSCNASLFIADEPTTALDVTIQAQILELMRELKEKENKSIMLITHDMGVVAEMADEVMVMYAGKEMEYGDVKSIFKHPLHPYTQGLLKSIPRLDQNSAERLFNIPGSVPDLSEMPKGCRFCTRCTQAQSKCHEQEPGLYDIEGQKVRCWKYAPEGGWEHEVE